MVCQMAKIKKCRVIGSCGSDEKARWLVSELGIDHAINYRKTRVGNLSSELSRVYPNGIDIYFYNVVWEHLDVAIHNMNIFGRLVLCGTTSQYNDDVHTNLSNQSAVYMKKSVSI